MGVLQHLAQQTADQANQMTTTVNALQQKINAQNEAVSGKLDTVSGQVQSLNDSVDELKSRIAKLDKTVQDLQTQLQTMQSAAPAAAQQPGRSRAGRVGKRQDGPAVRAPGQPGAGAAPGAAARSRRRRCRRPFRPACATTTRARYQVAQGEFQDVVHYYPLDDLAGTAQFYLGEIAYQQKDYPDRDQRLQRGAGRIQRQRQGSGGAIAQGIALLAMDKKRSGHSTSCAR